MANDYFEAVDLAFSIIFGIQILINLVVFFKQIKRREFIIVLVNLLLTVNLACKSTTLSLLAILQKTMLFHSLISQVFYDSHSTRHER